MMAIGSIYQVLKYLTVPNDQTSHMSPVLLKKIIYVYDSFNRHF